MNPETDWIETRMACPPLPISADDAGGAVDWHDLHLNGMPAVHRAISRLQKAQERAEMAHRAEICALTERVEQLEYLWSEEIIADLGHGWRIERSPNDITKPKEQDYATE